MAEIDGVVEIVKEMKRGKRTILVNAEGGVVQEHLVPHGKHLRVQSGDLVRAGQPLIEGPLIPHDILRINGEEALQQYVMREVQNVYRSQDVTIDDKHIEIIVSQMMRKIMVEEAGDSDLLPGVLIDKHKFRRIHDALAKEKKKRPKAEPQLLGITKASLQSESLISAASFQETTKVLTEAALAGKKDELVGLKENVILGHLVPTGTGFKNYHWTRIKKNVAPPPPPEEPELPEEPPELIDEIDAAEAALHSGGDSGTSAA